MDRWPSSPAAAAASAARRPSCSPPRGLALSWPGAESRRWRPWSRRSRRPAAGRRRARPTSPRRPGLIGGAPYGAAKAGVLNLMGHVHAVLRDKGIRATTIMPAEVDTPILDKRPLPPDARARATMMQPEDVARAVLLCVTLPPRTVVEEMVMSPTIQRDMTADI